MKLNDIYLGDSYELIKQLPDKSVDLILTDPPYGIGMANGVITKYGSSPDKTRIYNGNWDNKTPNKEMFDEILRVGKKVIIFGGNYFTDKLPQSNHWIVWDKQGEIKFNNPFSACELVWTNIKRNNIKKYTFIQQGFVTEANDERVHPTQKPLELIKNIIEDYTVENDLILDCYLGSGTTAVACKETNRQYIGFEINPEYYQIAVDRLNGISQQEKRDKENGLISIFDLEEMNNNG